MGASGVPRQEAMIREISAYNTRSRDNKLFKPLADAKAQCSLNVPLLGRGAAGFTRTRWASELLVSAPQMHVKNASLTWEEHSTTVS
eukprot:753531-Amphidinium_carterae.1